MRIVPYCETPLRYTVTAAETEPCWSTRALAFTGLR